MAKQTQKFAILVGSVLVALSVPSESLGSGEMTVALAPGSVQLMRFLKHSDEKAKGGVCVAPPKSSVESILKRSNITAPTAKPGELEALARGVQQIQALGGEKPFTPIQNAKFVFRNSSVKGTGQASGGWNGSHIHIERNGAKPDENVAHLMHELGHYVGGHEGLYDKYRGTVAVGCHYTLRCRHNLSGNGKRQEEFAEVFAAFVLHPELLKKSGPNCLAAYNFFADRVFPKGRELAFCGSTLPREEMMQVAEGPIPQVASKVRMASLEPARSPSSAPICIEPARPSNQEVLSLGQHLREAAQQNAEL